MNEPNGKLDVLLVDDKEADLAALLSTLRKANLCNRIHVLRQGGEILDFLFRTGSFSGAEAIAPETLILLSLNLQGTPGIEVLRKLKSDARSRDFPVIVLSSSQEDRGVMQAYKLGANACIVKPVELHKVIEAAAETRLGWLLMPPEDIGGGAVMPGGGR